MQVRSHSYKLHDRQGVKMEIREAQIEDILVNAPELTKNILQLDEMPFLLCAVVVHFELEIEMGMELK